MKEFLPFAFPLLALTACGEAEVSTVNDMGNSTVVETENAAAVDTMNMSNTAANATATP